MVRKCKANNEKRLEKILNNQKEEKNKQKEKKSPKDGNKAVRKMEAMINTKQITKQNQWAFKILPFI